MISTEGAIGADAGESAFINTGMSIGTSADKGGPVFYLHDELRSPVRTASAGGALFSSPAPDGIDAGLIGEFL